ncbi:MAG TPA: response regulator transcription factor [Terriglobales bacterium]|nr:response regulator transcription factor [Terriglobales bacterium]
MPPPPRALRPLAAAPAAPAVRIVCCLPSQLWNHLLATALAATPGFEVGVHAPPAPPPATRQRPTVALLATPEDRAGWERLAAWARRGEGLHLLVLGENRAPLAARALRAGAHGFLDWQSPLPLLVKAVRAIAAGELWAERKLAWTLARNGEPARGHLTPREQRVLEALAEGKRNKEIAALLAITETTVKSHLNRAYHKLRVEDRLQAALYVARHGV